MTSGVPLRLRLSYLAVLAEYHLLVPLLRWLVTVRLVSPDRATRFVQWRGRRHALRPRP